VVEYRQEEQVVVVRDALPINAGLVWDYEIPDDEDQDEAFRRWYVARVLTRGRMEDIRSLGIDTVQAYFPHLVLPARIHRFWEWYLNLPDVKVRHEPADSASA
jgi:hypothetical protein